MDQVERSWRDLAHCRADHQHDLHGDIQDAILLDHDRGDWWQGEPQEWMEKRRSGRFDYCHAQHRLQFQQLDWHRHGFLLWAEQSGFNHNGWTHHGDGDIHS